MYDYSSYRQSHAIEGRSRGPFLGANSLRTNFKEAPKKSSE